MSDALQVTITAPVASFRNPLYSGVHATLPCPPPSTVVGLMAAAAGGWAAMPTDTSVAMAFTAGGKGTDLETHHPLDRGGAKSNITIKDIDFLAETTLTLWIAHDLDLWERAFRRPVWPLRLGRSQDLASARTQRITLHPEPGRQGHALVPLEYSTSGTQLRMTQAVAPDRTRVRWGSYCYAEGGSTTRITGSWSTDHGQAVVFLQDLHPHAALTEPDEPAGLSHIWAKSPKGTQATGEALTTHLQTTAATLQTLRQRIGGLPALPEGFWDWARLACLFHDAGKLPAGFQTMVGNPTPARPWDQRHEIYSLGFIEHVLAHLPEHERTWIGLATVTHHRPLMGSGHSIHAHAEDLADPDQITRAFAPVDANDAHDLAAWLAHHAGTPEPPPTGPEELAKATHTLLRRILDQWPNGESPTDQDGLTAVLLQGALTLADHAASSHTPLLTTHPLTHIDYPALRRTQLRLNGHTPYPHQTQAQATSGHMAVRAPTGTGKTETALLWASTQTHEQTQDTGGRPRLFYTLPYLASINAMSERLGKDLGADQIGVVHSRAAHYHLARASDDDPDKGEQPRQRASRAVAKANASRLFRELVRITTPYQLLRAAIAGPAHASTLIDAAGSTFVFDELHAYEPTRLGMILALMGQLEALGGRIGIISATLPDALLKAVEQSLHRPVARIDPPHDHPWPHRHRLHLDQHHLTSDESIHQIQQRLDAGRSVAVVANTVADAVYLYRQLAPTARQLHGPGAAMLLHSRFKPEDRNRIEKALDTHFGSTAHPRQPGLLVGTQAVEVSLDLDFDELHTSGAPLEALLQRFGRVNRRGALAEPAPVTVHRPHYAPRGKNGPLHADKVYEAEPTHHAWKILAHHDGEDLDEADFTAWLDQIYDPDTAWGKAWISEVERSRSEFTQRYLNFVSPLNDHSELTEAFDQLFDGAEGILAEDRQAYADALDGKMKGEEPGTGALLASQYLIPLPHRERQRAVRDDRLGVLVIDAEYNSDLGLIDSR